jgi:hypothetical protein
MRQLSLQTSHFVSLEMTRFILKTITHISLCFFSFLFLLSHRFIMPYEQSLLFEVTERERAQKKTTKKGEEA